MLRVSIALLLYTTASAALAQDLPRCAVGLHVDKAGGTNEPGVITDADEAQGSYKLKYDNSNQEYWMGSPLLDVSCVGAPAGAKDIGFFAGPWDEVHLRGEPELVINPDGTYEWLVSLDPDTIIRGNWRPADPASLDKSAIGPGVVLVQGLGDRDWIVETQGDVDGDNREQILATDPTAAYFYFFRSNGPKT